MCKLWTVAGGEDLMRRQLQSAVLWSLCALCVTVTACHPDDNDPKGQAGDLKDPVRREFALGRLQSIYSQRLSEAKGDRSKPPIKEFCDATVEPMTKLYIEHPEDTQNGLRVLSLLNEMRDPRALPALIKALEWKAEVSEDHAVTAALTMIEIDIPADQRGAVVDALGKALLRVDGARGADNRMRKSFTEVLGKLKDRRAIEPLTKIALKRDASQSFLFNILALQQLVAIADPSTTATFIKGLYWFDSNNPAMRMNDVATSGLVAIGKPALEPLLKVLNGEDAEANNVVKLYIETVKQKDADAARKMNAPALISTEATFSLGKLGFREALDPLIEESKSEDKTRAMGAALALVSIVRAQEDTPKIVEALTKVYGRLDMAQRPQLLVAMRHMYAPELLPFLMNVAKTKVNEYGADGARLYAFQSYALLANKTEMAALKALFDKEPLYKEQLPDHVPLFTVAGECDANTDCWTGKLKSTDKVVLRKAASSLARFGRGNDKAISALVQLFSHRDLEVRNEALSAVDAMAVKGSKEAVQKIDELETVEGGRSIWNNFKREALPTRSRLQLRAGA
jgi:HEAT repeat protein